MSLPYENATSGKAAMDEVRRILQDFGVTSFGHMEDFSSGELVVQFEWRSRRVSIRANAKGYAAAWLKRNPWNTKRQSTETAHKAKALRQGQVAVYSILRDWIKGQVTAVETGMLSFEGAFLGQILLPNGNTVLQHIEQSGALAIEDKT